MMRDLQKRLLRVESVLPSLPSDTECWISALVWFGIAYYLGKPAPKERPFVAFVRALGYHDERELKSDVANKDWMVSRKIASAKDKLFEIFGIRLVTLRDDPKRSLKYYKGLKRIEAGLPVSYKKRLKKMLTRADINIAWIQENGGIVHYLSYFP
jgi:hypothetical protein